MGLRSGRVVSPLATWKVGIGCKGESGAYKEGCRAKGVVVGSPPLIWNILKGCRVEKKQQGYFR